MSATWTKAGPPPSPAPGKPAQVLAGLRLGAAFLVTVVLLLLFLLLRPVDRLSARRLRPHLFVKRLWARCHVALFGLKLVRRGRAIREGGVIVANHSSWLDIFVLRSLADANFVSKAEVRKWPLIGALAAVTGTLFIERRRTAAREQQSELLTRIQRGDRLCFFPEGTSTDGLRVLPFKSSLMAVVFAEGVHETALVQPVSVVYRPKPGAGLPDCFYGWWGDMEFSAHIWAVATLSHGGTVEVTFHEPVRAADWSDRKALTAHCENEVRSAFPPLAEEG